METDFNRDTCDYDLRIVRSMQFTNRSMKHQISELSKLLQSWLLSKCFSKINSTAWNPSVGIWLIRPQIGTIVASYNEADLDFSPMSCTPGNLTCPVQISSCTFQWHKFKRLQNSAYSLLRSISWYFFFFISQSRPATLNNFFFEIVWDLRI